MIAAASTFGNASEPKRTFGGFKQEYFIPNVPDSGLLTDDEIRKLVWRHWPRVLNERRVGKSAQRGTRVGREGWPDATGDPKITEHFWAMSGVCRSMVACAAMLNHTLQSVFSSPPRLATSRPDLDMVRRVAEAKNALHYMTSDHPAQPA